MGFQRRKEFGNPRITTWRAPVILPAAVIINTLF